MLPSIEEVQEYVAKRLADAREAASQIKFEQRSTATKAASNILSDIARFSTLGQGQGVMEWATVLFVDLRSSTDRAIRIGPRDTYISMHCYLGTLAYLVGPAGGIISNFRGDGLFAVFGLDDHGRSRPELNPGSEVMNAFRCGQAMVEAIDRALNPALLGVGIDSDLRIGVGIDCGRVVITRIGLLGANEVTLYGPAVNRAAKLCGGNGEIVLSIDAEEIYPTGEKGRVQFSPVYDKRYPSAGDQIRGYRARYPQDLRMLKSRSLG